MTDGSTSAATDEQSVSRIDDELEHVIEETVESEADFHSYIRQERDRRRQQAIEQVEDEVDDDTTVDTPSTEDVEDQFEEDYDLGQDTDLDKYTARAKMIAFIDRSHKFAIDFEDYEGNVHTEYIEAGLPEDDTTEWVRLCEWAGVDPEYPTKLRGERIPVTWDSNGDVQLEIPPVQKRLNPLAFTLRRATRRYVDTLASIEPLAKAATLAVIAIGLLLPAIGTAISLAYFTWARTVSGTGGPQETIATLLTLPMFVIYLISGGAAIYWYGRMAYEGFIWGLGKLVIALARGYRFLFPSSS